MKTPRSSLLAIWHFLALFRSVNARFLAILLFMSAGLIGCSSSPALNIPVEVTPTSESSESGLVSETPQLIERERPFELELEQEINADGALIVFGRVYSKRRWSLSEVLLRARLFDDSGMVSQRLFPLDEFALNGKEELSASFSVNFPIEDATDYQIELLWGDVAQALRKRALLEFVKLAPERQALPSLAEDSANSLVLRVRNTSRALRLQAARLLLRAESDALDLDLPIFQDGALVRLSFDGINPQEGEDVEIDVQAVKEAISTVLGRDAEENGEGVELKGSDQFRLLFEVIEAEFG